MGCKIRLDVIFISILFSSCSIMVEDIEDNDWDKDNLKGKVKSYSEFSYQAVEQFGEIIKGEDIVEVEPDFQKKYDDLGNLIEESSYDDGNLSWIKSYKYSGNGDIIEIKTCHQKDNFMWKQTFNYDEENNLIDKNEFESEDSEGKNEDLRSRKRYKHDNQGNLIEENWYKSDGGLSDKFIYEYDEKGNLMKKNRYYSDGSLYLRKHYVYDKENNLIEENQYFANGSGATKNIYKYDEKRNLTEQSKVNVRDTNVLWLITYKFDEMKNLIEETKNIYYGRSSGKYTFRYDRKGNLIEEGIYFLDGGLITRSTYDYDFDERGNWVRMVELTDENPIYIYEREYEYFD